MLDALIRNRDAIVDPGDLAAWKLAEPTRESKVERWDPWVRLYLGLQALLEGLRFETPGPGNAHDGTGTVALYASADRSCPLVSISRPPHATFVSQLPQVLDWAELRGERYSEILSQIDNQYAAWGSIVPLNAERMRKTAQLVEVVIQFCVLVEVRFKHEFNCRRPAELSAQVQPLISTPGHGAFPSGHCTQAYAVAHVLGVLFGRSRPALRVQLDRLAARISMNRVVAGVHFPVDNLVGRMLGASLGAYVVARCKAVGKSPATWQPRQFDGTRSELTFATFDPFAPDQVLDGKAAPPWYRAFGPRQAAAGATPVLRQLWGAAALECADLA